jgi:hypothetical protein
LIILSLSLKVLSKSRIAVILITFLLAVPAMSAELFRHRSAARDGGTLGYVFQSAEAGRPEVGNEGKGGGDC